MTSIITIDRLTITGLAVAALLPFLALSPVKAAERGTRATCAAEAAAVQEQANGADPKAAAKALRAARVAEKMCAEGNRFEAGKKFAQARQLLDTSIELAANR